ncbi:unnamed protein product [Nezara viridula]|uniref:Uncharacterized protein n=1 Tax=Nezara viridula TaxID=85310 RepID=A0A9P0HNQ1_NEZVI|nr:unnamed protein product [Nezara viridula]
MGNRCCHRLSEESPIQLPVTSTIAALPYRVIKWRTLCVRTSKLRSAGYQGESLMGLDCVSSSAFSRLR